MAVNDPVGSPVWELKTLSLGTQAGLSAAVEGVAADARHIYLTHYLFNPQNPLQVLPEGRLIVFDADTLTALGEVPVGRQPRGIAVNPITNRLYVLHAGLVPSLMVFNANSLNNLTTIPVTATPGRVALSLRHNRIYISVANPSRSFVQVIDGSNNATLTPGIDAEGVTGITVDDEANRIYVTLAPPANVSPSGALLVIDSPTNRVIRSVPISPGQSQPQDVAVLPASNRIYVTTLGLDPGSGAVPSPRLTVLDRNSFATVAEVALPAPATHLAADPQANKVYAATLGGVVVIDGVANRIETMVPVEWELLGVAVSPRTGQVVAGDASGGRASVATQPSASEADLTLVRADDLLYLEFDFVNLRLITSGDPRLVHEVAGQPAFVIVHLAPQSLTERTVRSGLPVAAPLRARLAGRSRLAFRVPNGLAIPYTVEGLLDWSRLQPSLVPVALPRGPASAIPSPPPLIAQPSPTQTAIELPYRLTLSPDATATWAHANRPVTRSNQTELWHTRLISRQDDRQDPAVRAVWSPDFETPNDPPALSSVPLQTGDRNQIVRLTSDFTLVNGQLPYLPEPVEADELMLSTLGGWLKVRGAWNAPPELGLDLVSWHQITTLGRDHYVRVVRRGALFPFGHRAVRVRVTEREITASTGTNGVQGPVAALRTREYLVVLEPEKRYTGQPYTNEGREMPFARGVRLLTTVTPDIDPTERVAGTASDPAFWVRTTDGEFSFDVAAEDPEGRRVTFTAQMIFISEPLLSNEGAMADVREAHASDRGAGVVAGQPIAFVEPRPTADASADVSLTTERLYFATQAPGGGLGLPTLKRAIVRIPAVEQLLGVSEATAIQLTDQYLAGGLDSPANSAAVFAQLEQALPVGLPAATAGGLATAAFELTGISERLGPVAGDLDALAQGQFNPKTVLDVGSKLLGTVSLADLIAPVTNSSQFSERLPTMRTEIQRNESGLPQAVIGRLHWSPQVQSVGPFKTALNGRSATLTIDAEYRQSLTGGEADYAVTGVLSDFQIDFFGVVAVNFQRLEFRSLKGEKVDIDPVLAPDPPVEFKGALAFLDRLREYIPFDGFSGRRPGLEAAADDAPTAVVPRAAAAGGGGPALDVTQRGVEASYSLGLPPLAFGAFNLQNVTLGAGLSLPFVEEPARLRFNFAERHSPFQLTVLALGGGGFFALEVALDRVVGLEAALEFGAAAALNLGVARGSVHVMGGIYFALRAGVEGEQSDTELTGYLRCGGELRVLGLVSVSVEFYMELSYRSSTDEVRGQATLTVQVSVLFFRKKVSLTLERRFAGPGGVAEALAPQAGALIAAEQSSTFGDGMDEADWRAYVTAFA